jgi:hypothetical protein
MFEVVCFGGEGCVGFGEGIGVGEKVEVERDVGDKVRVEVVDVERNVELEVGDIDIELVVEVEVGDVECDAELVGCKAVLWLVRLAVVDVNWAVGLELVDGEVKMELVVKFRRNSL